MSKSRAAEAADAQTLADLVADFKRRLGTRGPLEHGYLDWVAASPRLSVAVLRACESKMPNGKRHNHQSRIPMETLRAFANRLSNAQNERSMMKCRTFHDLLLLMETCALPGIGPVTQYDVASRLGPFLGLAPERVYLHAGVRQGAEAMGLRTKGKMWLMREELPQELASLTADDCEDFFCVYRTLFPRLRKEVVEG